MFLFSFFYKISVVGDINNSNLVWSYVNALDFNVCQDAIK